MEERHHWNQIKLASSSSEGRVFLFSLYFWLGLVLFFFNKSQVCDNCPCHVSLKITWEPPEPFQCCTHIQHTQHSSWVPWEGWRSKTCPSLALMPSGNPTFSRWSSCFKSPQGRCVRNPGGFPSLGHPHLPFLLCFSTGSSALCFADFPCLQLLRSPCCGFLGAFLNRELVNSSRPFQQWKQSKSPEFPPRCAQTELSRFACGAWAAEDEAPGGCRAHPSRI